MTSQTGQQVITTHTLFNISRSKDNQTMKFGQLIEHDLRNIFLKNHAKLFFFKSLSKIKSK